MRAFTSEVPAASIGQTGVTRAARVLLVEDSATQAFAFKRLLQAEGYVVLHVTTLAEATAAARSGEHIAALLDLVLPDATSLDVVTAVARAAPDLPLVVLTSLTDQSLAIDALRSGAEDYLVKDSVTQETLGRTLRYAVERNRTKRELARIADKLRMQNVELADLAEQKSRFLGIASHDLRGPLGAVLGYCEMLESGEAGAIASEPLELIVAVRTVAETMLRLVEDFLDVSRMGSGELMLDLQDADLADLVLRAAKSAEIAARAKQVPVEVELPPDALPVAIVDAARFLQMLGNLLGNAVKFSHPGSNVEVRVSVRGADAVVAVVDHGVGIPADALLSLFDPSRVSRRKGTQGEKSTGLGLAIVHQIARAHGGSVEVESTEGEGATFTVRLPVLPE